MGTATAVAGELLKLEFRAASIADGDVQVVEVRFEEELSRPFSARVDLVAADGLEVDPAGLLDDEATVVIRQADEERVFHGVVTAMERWDNGRDAPRHARWVVQLGPTLWRLGQRQGCRIFQELSVPEIVTRILREGGVEHELRLSRTYPKREYCVQYRETDLDFVSRLLEEAGIFYAFEHAEDRHLMVLVDGVSSCPDVPGAAGKEIPYREWRDVEEEHVEAFLVRRRIRPAVVTLRDFDFLRPGAQLEAKEDRGGDLEVYDYPGGYRDEAAGRAAARVRLEALQVGAETFAGASASKRLAPGAVFELTEHPNPEFNGEFLLVAVHHDAWQPDAVGNAAAGGDDTRRRYRNDFVCIRKSVPFRPAPSAPRPIIPGAQTAIVVGPAGEEIHTDAHGRIKVQFHWDREGRKDERASCWVRVAQAWAGPGWGALYLPRIGHEVVVEFLEGDPDRPLVTGSVYNGLNPPPIALPDEKTRSTLRSASSPGSNGANELRFEDAAGQEEIYLHAQKDLEIEIENDKTQQVGANETLRVENDRSRSVGGNQTLLVEKDDSSTIQENQSLTVGVSRTTSVGGNHSESVGGDQRIHVGGSASLTVALTSTETVGLAKALNVGAAYAVSVGGAMNELVGGVKAEEIGAAKSETIGGKKTEQVAGSRTLRVGGGLTESVGKSRTLKVGKDLVLNVKGSARLAVSKSYTVQAKKVTIVAQDEFAVKVGSATLTVKKSGDVVIQGSKVQVKASGPLTLKGSPVSEN